MSLRPKQTIERTMITQYVIRRRGHEWLLQTAATPDGVIRSTDFRYIEALASSIARTRGATVLVLGEELSVDGRFAYGVESANDPWCP